MENTGISWAHHSHNFWKGCDKCGPECRHCYLGDLQCFKKTPAWGNVTLTGDTLWRDPIRWEAEATKANHALRVFTCSISDFFHKDMDRWRPYAWRIIKATPHIAWLILTKRPALIESRLPADWGQGYDNVWLGVSTGCNKTLHKMDVLRKIPCALRWVSTEPLLEDISQDINLDGFGWVVTGGESGFGDEYLYDPADDWRTRPELKKVIAPDHLDDPSIPYSETPHMEYVSPGRRIMMLRWAMNLRDKTKAAGLPFMFKQVTSANSGVGVNALGQVWHEFPPAPNGMVWAPRKPIAKKNFWTQAQIEKLWTEQNQRKSGRK